MTGGNLHVIGKRQPLSPDALDRLDEISALIELMEIKDLAIIAVTRSGDVKTYSSYTSAPRLLGALEWCRHVLIRKWESE